MIIKILFIKFDSGGMESSRVFYDFDRSPEKITEGARACGALREQGYRECQGDEKLTYMLVDGQILPVNEETISKVRTERLEANEAAYQAFLEVGLPFIYKNESYVLVATQESYTKFSGTLARRIITEKDAFKEWTYEEDVQCKGKVLIKDMKGNDCLKLMRFFTHYYAKVGALKFEYDALIMAGNAAALDYQVAIDDWLIRHKYEIPFKVGK